MLLTSPCSQGLYTCIESQAFGASQWVEAEKWIGLLTASTVDSVTVAGCGSEVDNRVETGEGGAVVAGHAPEGIG